MSPTQGNNPFDDNIRKRLEDASFQPPAGLWDKIEKELPERIPFYIRFKFPIVAAVLTFTIMSSLIIYNRFEKSIISMEQNFAENFSLVEDLSNNSNTKNSSNLATLQHQNIESDQESIKISIDNNSNKSNKVKTPSSQSSLTTTSQVFEGASYSTKSTSNNSFESNTQNELKTSKKKNKSERKPKSISDETSNESSESILNDVSLSNSNITSTEIAENLAEENTSFEKNQEDVKKLDLLASDLFQDDENATLEDSTQKGKKKSFKNKFVNKGLVVGPLVGAHYTAMTKKSNEGINTSKLEQEATFGTTYGLNIGYVINHRWSVGMEWIYNSDEGQKFNEIIKSQNVEKYIDLNYMKIPVYFKYTHRFVTRYDKSPITLNFVGGVHYSKLKSVNTFIDGQIAPVKVNYNEQEWGMLGGIEFDIFPTNRLYFTLGSRMTFNADLKQFPRLRGRDGSDPFSIQSGVYAKINYVFSFKKKK